MTEESDLNFIGCVMLLPSDTSVSWFKEAVTTASEVRLITVVAWRSCRQRAESR